MKLCKACGQTKSLDDFHNDRSKPDGKNFYCKSCMNAKTRKYAAQPPRRIDPEGMRTCNHCKVLKPLSEYHASKAHHDGIARRCKTCSFELHAEWRRTHLAEAAAAQKKWREANPGRASDIHIQKNYGLPFGSYDRMFAEQNGQCAICHTTEAGGKGGKTGRFHVDHCHDTGAVRGLLCHGCNVSLGHFKHSEEILLSAIQYLKRQT